MLPILLLFIVSTASSDKCPYTYDNLSYSRTAVLTIKGLPTNLIYNRDTKDLLFTLIDLESLQNDDVQTKMDQYVLRNENLIKIDNVKGQAAAVDYNTSKVYIASDEGLTVLNDSNKAEYVALKGEDIVQLYKTQHNRDLYVVMFPDNDVYTVNMDTKEKKRVENVPCAYFLAVDAMDNVFYECDSKYVKVLLKDFQEPIEYVGIGKNSARAIAVDAQNNVILATNDGLYYLNPYNIIPKKLMNLDFVPSGLAFGENSFYVATSGVIYKYDYGNCNVQDL
ncbi:uncharacterized protein LOC119189161 [Manduca sexta]|uniref:uncharacterized protein LOC119189161 n=1 Tax=Manduca sexta TaxID=7130 RepID=UPI00188EEE7D|nr:uncharacterized protein LOC119189161 [Manduca sexta]